MGVIQKSKQKKRFSDGFTLIELIMTVAILSFGIVTIYEALFISVDTFGFYTNYLDTQDWIDEKIWETKNTLVREQTLETGSTSGQVVRDNKTFDWIMMISPVNEGQGLYQVEITFSWKQGSKKVRTSRSAYLLPPQLKTYNEEGFA